MKIKNIEVNFDFLDADDMEKFENEAKKVIEECEKGENAGLSYSQVIREQCRIINNFFDNVFGEGISEKLFGNKNNLREHTDAFEEIVKEKEKEQQSFATSLSRYQPNRETRRSKRK